MIASRASREIRVAIVSEHLVFGESLACALGADAQLSIDAVVSHPRHAGLRSALIGVIILDVEGLRSGLDSAVTEIRDQAPRASVIALGSRELRGSLHRSIESGADGHVSKEEGLDELRRAIVCVADGVSFVDPRSRQAAEDEAEPAIARLSARERDVLRLLVEGRANLEIGTALNLSHKTVKNHVSNILSKLQTTSRTQAAIHALRSGIF